MSNFVDTRRVFSLIFIAGLAVLFALQWGPGSKGCISGKMEETDSVATVNGTPIPLRDFAREYLTQAEQVRRQGVPADMLKQFGLHKQALDRMVNSELLAQAAEKKGLSASDEDLIKLYNESPMFQKDGKFDHEAFSAFVLSENTNEVKFEEKLRRQLAAQRLLQLVESSAVVSAEEVKTKYLKEGDAAKVSFVRFTPAMFAAKVPAPKPAELNEWVKGNEKAIGDFYEQNKFTYSVPEKVKARQILLKLAPDATEAVKTTVKQRAENLRKDLVENKKPFAEVAKGFSEDLETKEKGGDLGLVDRLQLPPAFADALFALQPGETTAAIETPMGWFIGAIDEKRPAEQKTLEQVKLEIATQLLIKEKSKAIAKTEAEKSLVELKKGKSLSDLFPADGKAEDSSAFGYAAETKPTLKETAEFNASAESIPSLGASPEVMKAVFARTTAGSVEQLFTVGDALTLVAVTERKLTSDEAFEKTREELTLQAIKGKQYEVREAFLKSLKQSAAIVTNEKAIDKVVGADT